MEYKLASSTWGDEEIAAIHNVIESGMYSMGPAVQNYESEFATLFGAKHALMTSSGSSANLLMIAALFFSKDPAKRLKRGDEIIVPSVSWSTTYFPLQQYGLKVKFVDIDRMTLNIDLKSLETAISGKTKAILLVNLLGNPNEFDKVKSLIKGKEILLLEDNCESMGAVYQGRYAGTYGIMGTFSSFFSHHIATMEGGCVLTDDEELYHIMLCLRAHGWTRNLPAKNQVTGQKSIDPFSESFKFVLPGYNVRPLEMSGAIGSEQIKKLPHFIDMRRRNAEVFISLFNNHPYIDVQDEKGESSWFGFSMVLNDDAPISRQHLVTLLGDKNIECRPIVTGNFLKNTEVLEYFDFSVHQEMINAEYIDQNGFFIGNNHIDAAQGIQYVKDVIDKIFSQ